MSTDRLCNPKSWTSILKSKTASMAKVSWIRTAMASPIGCPEARTADTLILFRLSEIVGNEAALHSPKCFI